MPGITPDARHGEFLEDDGILLGTTSLSSQAGEIRYDGTKFSLYDATGEFDPRSGGGITEAQHKLLDQLVHDIAETCHYEITWDGSKAIKETWWATAAKLIKIREVTFTYTGSKTTQELIEQYNGAGTKVATLQIDYTYTGSRLDSATYTYSEP